MGVFHNWSDFLIETFEVELKLFFAFTEYGVKDRQVVYPTRTLFVTIVITMTS